MLERDEGQIEEERGNGFLEKTRLVNVTDKGKSKTRKNVEKI